MMRLGRRRRRRLLLFLLLLLLLLLKLAPLLLLQLFHPIPQPRVLVLIESGPLCRRRSFLDERRVLLGRDLREPTRCLALLPPHGLWTCARACSDVTV